MGGDVRDFLDVVDYIYASDPSYIRPLDQELKDRLNPKKNPLFEHAEGTIFVAYRNGKCVGRVTATIDHEHLARYKDATGFFGFFDTIEDEEVARELLARAEAWLRGKGMKRGPRPGVDVDQRGARVPRRGLRDAAGAHEPAPPPVPGGPHREGRLHEGQGLLRLALHRRRTERARQARPGGDQGAPRGHEPPRRPEGHRARRRDHRRHLQRRLVRELGLRPAHAEGGREDGLRLQADPRAGDHAHRARSTASPRPWPSRSPT